MVVRFSHDDRIEGSHALALDLETLIEAIYEYQNRLTPSLLNPTGADVRTAPLYDAVQLVERHYKTKHLPHRPNNMKAAWLRLLVLNDSDADDGDLDEAADALAGKVEAELSEVSSLLATKTEQDTEKRAKRAVKKKRGRNIETNPKDDKQTYDAWKSGQHNQIEDLANKLGKQKRDVQLAIDRHRKRQERKSR